MAAVVARKSRSQETRGARKRPEGWTPPNSVPTGIDLGPDVVARWIRKFFNGAEEDKQSFFKRLERGWEPVKPEELPQLRRLVDADGNIASNGCILCKIDKAIAAADVEYYEDMAIGALASAKSDYTKDAHEFVPKFSEGGKAKVFRGRLPA